MVLFFNLIIATRASSYLVSWETILISTTYQRYISVRAQFGK